MYTARTGCRRVVGCSNSVVRQFSTAGGRQNGGQRRQQGNQKNNGGSRRFRWMPTPLTGAGGAAVLAAAGGGFGWFFKDDGMKKGGDGKHWSLDNNEVRRRPDLPIISLAEVSFRIFTSFVIYSPYKSFFFINTLLCSSASTPPTKMATG